MRTAPLGFPVVYSIQISEGTTSESDWSSLQRCSRYWRSTCGQEGCGQRGERYQGPRLVVHDGQLNPMSGKTTGLTLCQVQDLDTDALSPLLEDALLSNTASTLQVSPVVHADNDLEGLALVDLGEREEGGDVLGRSEHEANLAVSDAEGHDVGSEGVVERDEREGVGRAGLVSVLPF